MRKNRRNDFKSLIEHFSAQTDPTARPVVDLLPRSDAINLWRRPPEAIVSGSGNGDQFA